MMCNYSALTSAAQQQQQQTSPVNSFPPKGSVASFLEAAAAAQHQQQRFLSEMTLSQLASAAAANCSEFLVIMFQNFLYITIIRKGSCKYIVTGLIFACFVWFITLFSINLLLLFCWPAICKWFRVWNILFMLFSAFFCDYKIWNFSVLTTLNCFAIIIVQCFVYVLFLLLCCVWFFIFHQHYC